MFLHRKSKITKLPSKQMIARESLWLGVSNQCLKKATEILRSESLLAADIEKVEHLTAIAKKTAQLDLDYRVFDDISLS